VEGFFFFFLVVKKAGRTWCVLLGGLGLAETQGTSVSSCKIGRDVVAFSSVHVIFM